MWSKLIYRDQHGKWRWKKDVSRKVRKHDVAGTIDKSNGRPYIHYDYKRYSMSKVIACMLGLRQTKNLVLDHIDGVPLNNDLSNLRMCSQKQNVQNSYRKDKQSCPFQGVYKSNSGKYYTKHSNTYLGTYDQPQQAYDVYVMYLANNLGTEHMPAHIYQHYLNITK